VFGEANCPLMHRLHAGRRLVGVLLPARCSLLAPWRP
jgi:hypothetical protein